ncbi:hypothetical protein [Kutzneria sp. CA-103260]|uniref:hypothetical protein n=1 Tax=Kutzneria sp. CA-103260 TaxID=2802641 RepID=UPI001BA5B48F|nr:hypothetical protein [Kutzneria sp. CA-103260]QUQ70238.1 hypothetical protein JJ691_80130 [Kutzneria sp. CA-103260]
MGQLGDIRFDGFSNGQLADQVNKLKQGQGAAALQPVMDVLHGVAQDLVATNDILHTQLGKLGIDWQSVAGQGATNTMNSTVNYGDDSQYNITGTNNALTTQADSHTVAQSAPAPSTDTQKSFVDNAAGFFGYQTDHSKEVEQAQADRDQAIQQLNAYQSNSQDAIASTVPMSAPPTIGLTAQPVQGTSVNQVGGLPTSGGGYGPGGSGYPGGSYSQVGGPGGGGYAPPGSVPGGGAGGVPGPGGVSGVGPGMGRLPGAMPPAAAAGGLLAEEVGLGAALAGGAGAVAAGARSGNPNTIVRGGGTNAAPGEKANTPSKASATAGAIDEEQAAQARAAERIAPGKPGASMMQPGAAGGRGKKEEDSEHDRKYTVEEDLFGEQRMVAPTVLGEDPDA